jgi:hypothetical protein
MAGSESGVAMMVSLLSVMAARRLWSHKLEFASLESLDRGRSSRELGQVYLDVRRLEFPKGTHANSADHHPIHTFTGKRQKRLAYTMAVIEIAIRDGPAGSSLRVDDQK